MVAKRPSRGPTPPEAPPVWSITRDDLVAAFGTDDQTLAEALTYQLQLAQWFPDGTPPEHKIKQMQEVLSSVKALAPRDASEALLVTQMIATHGAALECLRRASLEGQTFAGREMNLKHAEKLMGLYARQQEALDKHRGKGQQKITVEHVTVEAGGQAIVGNVQAGAKAPGAAPNSAPAALTFNPGVPAPLTEPVRDAEYAEPDGEA